jgi:opacity protein-like surface antigen
MKHLYVYAVFAVVLALSGTAWAHSDEELDKRVGAHGGQLRMAGQYHFMNWCWGKTRYRCI